MIFQLLACKSLLIPHITTPHILAKCHDIPINADVTRRWTCSSEHTGEIQIVLRTDGIPMDADIQMWNSPDSTPCRMRIYTENGATQHSLTTIQTPNNPYRIAIRNIGRLKDPIHASIFAYKKPYIEPDADKCNVIVQGGTFKAYDFNKCIDNIQVLLQTDGLPLNARIEISQGLHVNRQVVELYTENGCMQPYRCHFRTPGKAHTIRIVNMDPKNIPFFTSVSAY